ncbi:MAG: DUF3237 domain-containing protein [Novosphingobium sp.]|nr:DUF3237 domain-containing protein [Novosphingobium sp.]
MTNAALGPCMMRFTIDVGEPVSVGKVAGQERRCIPLLGGSVEGQYSGKVLPGGTDWQVIGPDGMLEISARYVLELDGARVEVRSDGLRSGSPEVLQRLARGEPVEASEYYFRTAMRFYTASPELDGLNHMLAIAMGERRAAQVLLAVHPVL